MSFTKQALLVVKRVFIVVGIAVAFTLGLVSAIYLSLRSSETRVPDIVGKDRIAAENTISDAGLNFRVRAMRSTSEAKPGVVIIQLPHAGEIVKVGQTVAVDISRGSANGESTAPESAASPSPEQKAESNTNSSDNTNEKPKKKPANKNANDNANSSVNRNQNRNANANRALTPPSNTNSEAGNANRPPRNSNSNRRPPAPAPTP